MLNSLVAYGESGDEGHSSSDEDSRQSPKVAAVKSTNNNNNSQQKQPPKRPAAQSSFLSEADTFGKSSTLPKSSLLLPSFKTDSSGKVKIAVPKVSDYDDDDDGDGGDMPPSKKQQIKPTVDSSSSNKPRCGLFSVLPPPRVHSSMIPPSVAGRRRAIATEEVEWGAKSRPAAAAAAKSNNNNNNNSTSSSAKATQSINTPAAAVAATNRPLAYRRGGSDDDDDGVDDGNDANFFSIAADTRLPHQSSALFDYGTQIGPTASAAAALPTSMSSAAKSNEFSGIFGPQRAPAGAAATSNIANYRNVRIDVVEGEEGDDDEEGKFNDAEDDDLDEDDDNFEPHQARYKEWLANQQRNFESSSSSAATSSSLNFDELRKVQGRHNKGEMVNIVECRADDLLDPVEYARQKAIDEAKAQLNGPNTMAAPRGRARSRHQITYLAWLAKEKETELKEFWSQSKMNKNQAKMKYGF